MVDFPANTIYDSGAELRYIEDVEAVKPLGSWMVLNKVTASGAKVRVAEHEFAYVSGPMTGLQFNCVIPTALNSGPESFPECNPQKQYLLATARAKNGQLFVGDFAYAGRPIASSMTVPATDSEVSGIALFEFRGEYKPATADPIKNFLESLLGILPQNDPPAVERAWKFLLHLNLAGTSQFSLSSRSDLIGQYRQRVRALAQMLPASQAVWFYGILVSWRVEGSREEFLKAISAAEADPALCLQDGDRDAYILLTFRLKDWPGEDPASTDIKYDPMVGDLLDSAKSALLRRYLISQLGEHVPNSVLKKTFKFVDDPDPVTRGFVLESLARFYKGQI